MAHYAEIDENNVVIRVIVASQPFIDRTPGRWIQTSYNTRHGVHYDQDGKPSGKPAVRWTFAGPGMYYHEELDEFTGQPPDFSGNWVFNREDRLWYPKD